jgi:hypothetical protein
MVRFGFTVTCGAHHTDTVEQPKITVGLGTASLDTLIGRFDNQSKARFAGKAFRNSIGGRR